MYIRLLSMKIRPLLLVYLFFFGERERGREGEREGEGERGRREQRTGCAERWHACARVSDACRTPLARELVSYCLW